MIGAAIIAMSLLGQVKPGVLLQDEGTPKGDVQVINCVGTSIACTRAGRKATLTISAGGPTTDDTIQVGNGTITQDKTLPSCSTAATSKLLYNTSSNTFSCGTDSDTVYTLPAATSSVLGGVKGTGSALTCSGTNKATGFASDGTLQCAADSDSASTMDPLDVTRLTACTYPSNMGGSGVTVFGPTQAPTQDGTWSSGNVSGDVGAWSKYTSGTGGGATAGWRYGSDQITLASQPIIEFRFRTDSVLTSYRCAFGIANAAYSADTVTTRGGWVRYSSNASDSNFMACSADGTTGTCEAMTTPVAVNGSTKYRWRVDFTNVPTDIKFYYWSGSAWVLKHTKTTNIPSTNLHFGSIPVAVCSNVSGGVARAIELASVCWSALRAQ